MDDLCKYIYRERITAHCLFSSLRLQAAVEASTGLQVVILHQNIGESGPENIQKQTSKLLHHTNSQTATRQTYGLVSESLQQATRSSCTPHLSHFRSQKRKGGALSHTELPWPSHVLRWLAASTASWRNMQHLLPLERTCRWLVTSNSSFS